MCYGAGRLEVPRQGQWSAVDSTLGDDTHGQAIVAFVWATLVAERTPESHWQHDCVFAACCEDISGGKPTDIDASLMRSWMDGATATAEEPRLFCCAMQC